MSIAVTTGSSGLIGSEAAIYFGRLGLDVVGIDNDMRRVFFGAGASTDWNRVRVHETLGKRYVHHDLDIRDPRHLPALWRRGRARHSCCGAALTRLGSAQAVRQL